jgi:hypothetical protein
VLLLLQHPEDAETSYLESEKCLAGVNRAKTRAYNQIGLAQIAELHGHFEDARTHAEEARKLFGNLGLANEAKEIAILQRLATPSQ